MATTSTLKKELGLFPVYVLATGATLSSGFFLLPGIAFAEAGPALTLAYLIAAIPVIPAVFSKLELSTAMPRSGGIYYFVDRSIGPLFGTISGFGTWLSLVLKAAFALVGIGAYMGFLLPDLDVQKLGIGLTLLFGLVNVAGAKKTGQIQMFLVCGLLPILAWLMLKGLGNMEPAHFQNYFDAGINRLIGTAGLVYVSFMGLTNVVSISGEVRDPERTLPRAMFLALGTALLLYTVGTVMMVGVVPAAALSGDKHPVATTALLLAGRNGAIFMSIAALLGFFSVANSAIMSSSRYPMAMSRDRLLPDIFGKVNSRGAPIASVILTTAVVLFSLTAFDPTRIAKLASAFQLLLFALCNLAVIVMRESRISSYDPGYRSPFYPWMQFIGILTPAWLIIEMGMLPLLFTLGLVTIGVIWYLVYARHRIEREGAIFHVFARLGERRYQGLETEMRTILKEKGLREGDPFEALVTEALVLEIREHAEFEEVLEPVAEWLAQRIDLPPEELRSRFAKGAQLGATPVTGGVALPHLRVECDIEPAMVLVRAGEGAHIRVRAGFESSAEEDREVHAIFFLVSSVKDPAGHLRILAEIAGRVDHDDFLKAWNQAADEQELKEVLIRDERFHPLEIEPGSKSAELIGQALRDVHWPAGSLVALVRRGSTVLIPSGTTVLQAHDRLTIIGDPAAVLEIEKRYG
jgi:amino acid transporter/mannitol/fructose-specific phosphotransferase system IIA component (Ntr-type)